MQFAIQQLSTQVLNPTTESKRAVKQLIRYLKGTQHTCLRLEPREMVQKGLLELVGRSDSDWAWRFGNAPKCYGISLRCTEPDDVQRKSEADNDQSQFMRSRVPRSQCLRRRTVGARRTLQGTSLQRFSSSRDGFRLGKTHSTAQGTRRTQTYRVRCLVIQHWIREKRSVGESSGHEEQHCRSLHETSGWIANTVACEETWTSNPGWYKWYKW